MYITKVDTYRGESFRIFSLCDEAGSSEIDKIAASINNSQIKQIEKLDATFERMALHGQRSLPTDRCHHIDDGIWQFRADDIRVFWFYDKGNVIICTHGFIKKVNRTPRKQIDKAKTVRAEYHSAKKEGQLTTVEEENE
ncbi:MAG: type II toxin-antitoxin system RelE/ParE family toxin [Geopsychrobacter sp.]|nr:type II toxin-antitoxin system RelE/ParE family toxin [Geopsychrobacter sp.]